MTTRPKTIQIFLPDGDPQGIRIAEITTRIVQVIEVPRSLLGQFLKRPESDQVAVYFLFGDSEDRIEQSVYIGQTGELRTRLPKHDRDKDFWERALILISRTNSLTQTHALYLEWHCLQEARKAGRYRDHNGNSGNRPHTPAPLEADCLEVFETAETLLATLGYPLFEPVTGRVGAGNDDKLLFCRASGAEGRGMYTEEGFVVLKGSVGRKENVPSLTGGREERLRKRLLESGVMRVDGETVVFEKDHLFRTPSGAAVALLGRASNGWKEWKDKDGHTLDALRRQAASATS